MQVGIGASGDRVLRVAVRDFAYVESVLLDAGGDPRDRRGCPA
jgi:hypothetical protein